MEKVLKILFLLTLIQSSEEIEENCTDFQGKLIEHGSLYVPGPSVCSMCVCYHSEPKWCSDIYCDPPYFCKKFRVKERCCEFECLDPPGDIASKMLEEHRRKFRNSASTNLSSGICLLLVLIHI
ncbi:hypothetical protein ABEB36_011475 [Hypothenemus hampei]|uniref:Integral membrane protein DGCR2/IDD-like n=1 Tax=Hypothenemus hampei TaxID=57062 RepID=A0ABD1EFT1_HYPHA